jgi:YD repeat-containing protein
MIVYNIDEYDANGNLIHHIGPSTEWRKQYDNQNREIRYERTDGQAAETTYAEDGTPTTVWIPPVDEPDA